MVDNPAARVADRFHWWHLAAGVAVVAFLARLLPALQGGGLYGVDHYDASVYFGSAVGLVHGRIPYRDFLLLHPPGITLALVPFAVLARLVGDADSMACARLAWMGLGALNSVLVARILQPLGKFPAVFGALFYAVFLPAVTIEQTTRLEGPASTCLLGTLALLTIRSPGTQLSRRSVVLAGALLGLSTSIKVWGGAPLLLVAVFVMVTAGGRRAGLLILGAAGAGLVVCLPFLLAAPDQMWRYVVTDQLGRGSSSAPRVQRLADITGLGLVDNRWGFGASVLIGIAVVCFVVGGLLACAVTQARLAVVLLGALAAMLLAMPGWLPHYAGLIAAPAAVTFGAATHPLLGWVRRRGPRWKNLGAVLLAVGLVPFPLQLGFAEFGDPFPGKRLSAAVAPLPGCITADDPSTLIAMNVLTRNLERGCQLSLDLGGYSYDFRAPGGTPVPRTRNVAWQRHALDYLSSGSATLVTRYSTSFGLSRATEAEIKSWPVLFRAGKYRLRQPTR